MKVTKAKVVEARKMYSGGAELEEIVEQTGIRWQQLHFLWWGCEVVAPSIIAKLCNAVDEKWTNLQTIRHFRAKVSPDKKRRHLYNNTAHKQFVLDHHNQ